ncbi:NYN domain-containing protein [Jannaschia faecimaris]|nr:NYN domain-containing protein [Jannaschia faecimaris]
MTASFPILANSAKTDRVAVFVDGDNISADNADGILRRIKSEGSACMLRIYGNAAKAPAWQARPEFQFIHAGTGKNAADILLCVEAMDLAHRRMFDTAIIASSDGDFRHLAFALRALSIRVVGLGENKAPPSFALACTAFNTLESRKQDAPNKNNMGLTEEVVTGLVHSVIKINSKGGRGITLKVLNDEMKREHGVSLTSLGAKTWRAFLKRYPELFAIDPSVPGDAERSTPMVRFLPEGFALRT